MPAALDIEALRSAYLACAAEVGELRGFKTTMVYAGYPAVENHGEACERLLQALPPLHLLRWSHLPRPMPKPTLKSTRKLPRLTLKPKPRQPN